MLSYIKYALIILPVLMAGCSESLVVIDPPVHVQKLVLNSTSLVNDTIKVQVGRSIGILDYKENKDNLVVSNASVSLFADGVLIETLRYDAKTKQYRSNTVAQEGKTYTLKAIAPSFTEASTICQIPSPVQILNVERRDSVRLNSDGKALDEIRITFNDPSETGDSYFIRILKKSVTNADTVWGNYGDWTLTTVDPAVETSDPDYDNVFFSTNEDRTIPLNDILLRDTYFNGKKKELILFVLHQYQLKPRTYLNEDQIETTETPYIEFNHINEDYYRFLKSLGLAKYTEGDGFSEPVNVTTNVTNGYGIFTVINQNLKPVE